MVRALDEALQECFDDFSIEEWTDVLRSGIGQFQMSLLRNLPELDYSGFELAEPLLHGEPVASALRELYDLIGPGKTQARIRDAVRAILMDLRPPPNQEALLVGPLLLDFAREARISRAMPEFAKKIRAAPAWRDSEELYHAALHLAFGLETHSDAADLIRAAVGPEGERSPHFKLNQVVPCLRALICSESEHPSSHLRFLMPELEAAEPLLLESVAAELLLLHSQEYISKKAWMAFEAEIPEWLTPHLKAAAGKEGAISLQQLMLVIDSTWRDAFPEAAQPPTASTRDVGEQLRRALDAKSGQLAAQVSLLSHALTLHAQQFARRPFGDWLVRPCRPYLHDILAHLELRRARDPRAEIRGEAELRRLAAQLGILPSVRPQPQPHEPTMQSRGFAAASASGSHPMRSAAAAASAAAPDELTLAQSLGIPTSAPRAAKPPRTPRKSRR